MYNYTCTHTYIHSSYISLGFFAVTFLDEQVLKIYSQSYFCLVFEIMSRRIAQEGLKCVGSNNLPSSFFQVAETRGMYHPTWLLAV